MLPGPSSAGLGLSQGQGHWGHRATPWNHQNTPKKRQTPYVFQVCWRLGEKRWLGQSKTKEGVKGSGKDGEGEVEHIHGLQLPLAQLQEAQRHTSIDFKFLQSRYLNEAFLVAKPHTLLPSTKCDFDRNYLNQFLLKTLNTFKREDYIAPQKSVRILLLLLKMYLKMWKHCLTYDQSQAVSTRSGTFV